METIRYNPNSQPNPGLGPRGNEKSLAEQDAGKLIAQKSGAASGDTVRAIVTLGGQDRTIEGVYYSGGWTFSIDIGGRNGTNTMRYRLLKEMTVVRKKGAR